MVSTAVRILREEFERLSDLEIAGRLERAGEPWRDVPILALHLVELERERDEIVEALVLLDPASFGEPIFEATGDLFAATA